MASSLSLSFSSHASDDAETDQEVDLVDTEEVLSRDARSAKPSVVENPQDADDAPYAVGNGKASTGTLRPPLMPSQPHGGPPPLRLFDGQWELVNPTEDTAEWLQSLTISGSEVLDADGEFTNLSLSRHGVRLCGGLLRGYGDGFARLGRSGGVQIYLRRGQ